MNNYDENDIDNRDTEEMRAFLLVAAARLSDLDHIPAEELLESSNYKLMRILLNSKWNHAFKRGRDFGANPPQQASTEVAPACPPPGAQPDPQT